MLHLCWEMSLDHARDWALQGRSGHSGDRVGAAVAWASVTEHLSIAGPMCMLGRSAVCCGGRLFLAVRLRNWGHVLSTQGHSAHCVVTVCMVEV